MPVALLALFVLVGIMTGCSSGLRDYPPPPQEPPLAGSEPARHLSDYVNMSDPNVEDYVVGGVEGRTESREWRLVHSPAELRFHVTPAEGQRFILQFLVPEARPQHGVTVTVSLNGTRLGALRSEQAVTYGFDKLVSPQWLKPDGENLVEIASEPASEFQLYRAGFVE